MLRVPTHTHLTSSAPVPHDTHPHLSLPQLWPPRGPLSCVRPSSPTCYREQVRGPGSSSVPHNFPLKSSNSPTNTLTDSALSSAAGGPRPMALRPPSPGPRGSPSAWPPGTTYDAATDGSGPRAPPGLHGCSETSAGKCGRGARGQRCDGWRDAQSWLDGPCLNLPSHSLTLSLTISFCG